MNELGAIENIIFIGYPSGLFDVHNSLPIVRRGITATPVWNKFNNQDRFLIDAGVFPSSSGSPVFIINEGGYSSQKGFIVGSRILFLGIISGTFRQSIQNAENFIGLGSVINSNAVFSFLQDIVAKLTSTPPS